MIEPINDIDRLLQAAPSRYGEAYARSLQLSASSRGFDVALDATVTPSAIVFIATRVGFTGGTVEFSTNNGTPLAVDGDVATLTPAALMGSGCEVVATVTYQGDTHVGRQSVTKLLAFDSSVPQAPTGLTAQGALASINLSWAAINDTNIATVEIWRALTNDIAAAAPIGKTAGLARTYPDVIGAGGKFYYWIRYVSKANVLGPFNAQAGTLGTTGTGAEHLLELLKDQITESQLLASLRDRINLAVSGSEGAANVAAALQAETEARIAAIDKEISDRLAALRDEAAAREAYVQNYTYSKVETDNALTIQAQVIASAFTSYADQAEDRAITAAAADVRNYAYSRAAIDAAESAQTNAITASYKTYADGRRDEALTAAAADVRTYAYSKAGTDGAIASMATTLRAEMASNGGASEAYVKGYTYSKAEFDSAQAGQSTALTTSYQQYADTRKGEAIATASADVRNYSYSKSAIDGGFASQFNTLTANYQSYANAARNNAIEVASADVRNYAYSKAGTEGAIASATTTLQSTVNGHTTSIQTQQQSINGLRGQAVLVIDNNGYVVGWGLASEIIDGKPTSSFIVNAANFAFVTPGADPQIMFSGGVVNGQTVVGFSGTLMGPSGTLNTLRVLDTLYGGDYTGWGWPEAGKNGFALGTSGLLLGNFFNGSFFEARRNGEFFTPQIESTAAGLTIKGNTTINGALLINPNFGNRTASIDNAGGNVFYPYRTAQNSFCGSHTASISNPVNPSYSWSISSSAVQATFYLGSTTNAQTQVYVSAKGALAGDEVECILTCVISDGGVTTSASKNIIAQYQ